MTLPGPAVQEVPQPAAPGCEDEGYREDGDGICPYDIRRSATAVAGTVDYLAAGRHGLEKTIHVHEGVMVIAVSTTSSLKAAGRFKLLANVHKFREATMEKLKAAKTVLQNSGLLLTLFIVP